MKVLVAEDERVCRRMLEATLTKWGYEVVLACDGIEAWQALQTENGPKLALLDWMMPGMNGLEVCRKVRHRAPEPYVYMILLSAKTQKDELVRGLEAGADDYMAKPFDVCELKARLRTGERILELQEQLIAVREALWVQATHDSLTGLWNRAAILDILRREHGRAGRGGTPLGLIIADLDHFKSVNDTYGHPAGDVVLQEVARRMRSVVRAYDSIGRYGGEEFLIIAPGCDTGSALQEAERLLECVSSEAIETPYGIVFPVSMSLGVTSSSGADEATFDLLQAADLALYRAKHRGRNRAEAAPEMGLTEDRVSVRTGGDQTVCN